ncbi:thiol:disulfide interchange protein DsbG [Marinobacter sp. F4216]|uniref:thiol:disulfide interchange protein DsbG n=1 Tax=Marinobacter sp. F4216 TaxID=2874281 RepID=UPI001CBE0FDA|nr:thiol:disulfide interchange protein DsbG [Marinobacter sp. F4216]MBZ2168073.1 thiol:disulfide interchange protein DsbG [Marinobacter sp. F4216]
MQRNIRLRGVLCLVFSGLFWSSFAGAQYPDALQVFIDQGLKPEASFDAPGGVKGFVGRKDGQAVTLYLLADGEHVIIGEMVDGFGRNLSAEHIRTWLPATDLTEAWAKLENATWVAEGPSDADRIVYAFTDPNCGYCLVLRRKAQEFLQEGIQLRHIMVGIIQPSSLAKSAGVISASDPVSQLDFHETEFPDAWLVSNDNIPGDVRGQILANHKLMQELGASVTPTVFYRDRSGAVQRIDGLPDDSALAESVFRANGAED